MDPSSPMGISRKVPTSATASGESVSSSTSHPRTMRSIQKARCQRCPVIQSTRQSPCTSERKVGIRARPRSMV